MADTETKEAGPRLLNIKKASVFSGLPVWTIRQLIWQGEIPFIQKGTKYYLDREDILAWIERRKTKRQQERNQ